MGDGGRLEVGAAVRAVRACVRSTSQGRGGHHRAFLH